MDSLTRNIYAGVTAETALELLSVKDFYVPTLAVVVPADTALLGRLYNALSVRRGQRFLFLLPPSGLPEEVTVGFMRFFFLTNYLAHYHAPQLLYTGASLPLQHYVKDWCLVQGFDEPEFLRAENFNEEGTATGDYVYVPAERQEAFLALLTGRIVRLERTLDHLVFEVNSPAETALLIARLDSLVRQLKENHTGIYRALDRIASLEKDLHKSEAVIRFQEIEIANHKLYIHLIMNGGGGALEEEMKDFDDRPLTPEEIKGENRNLRAENKKLKETIGWYKRTFEERSLAGTIKEKLFGKRNRR